MMVKLVTTISTWLEQCLCCPFGRERCYAHQIDYVTVSIDSIISSAASEASLLISHKVNYSEWKDNAKIFPLKKTISRFV